MEFVYPILIFVVMGIVFGVLLVVISKVFAVETDERAVKITDHFVDGRGTAEKGDELYRTEHGQQRLQCGFVRVGHVDRTHAPLPEDQRHHGHVDQGVHHGRPAETVGPAAPGVGPDHLRDLGPDGIRQSQIFQHLFQTAFRTDPIRI